MSLRTLVVPAILLLFLYSGCALSKGQSVPDTALQGEADGEQDLVTGTGTVRWYDVEGGFYAIESDDDTTYDPMNLPDEFREDGLRVYFKLKLRKDLVGAHMVGPLVEVITMRAL